MVRPKQSNKLITKLHYQNVPTQQPNPRHLSAPFSACRRLGNPYLCKERLDGEILGIADIVSIAERMKLGQRMYSQLASGRVPPIWAYNCCTQRHLQT